MLASLQVPSIAGGGNRLHAADPRCGAAVTGAQRTLLRALRNQPGAEWCRVLPGLPLLVPVRSYRH